MIPISDTEKQKWESGRYLKELKLYFPSINLTIQNDAIYGESMVLKESLFDGNGALEIVGCVSSSFSVEIRHQSQELKNQSIIASIRIDGGNWMVLFQGYVDSVETVRDRSYQKLICYDALYLKRDENVAFAYDNLGDTFTVKQLRDAIFSYELITQATQILPNDDVTLVKNAESNEISFGDAVRAICQMNGMFGIINRDGLFEYRQLSFWYDILPYPSDELFPSADLFPGEVDTPNHEYIDAYSSIKYEDYEVALIDKVTVRDSSSDASAGEFGTGDNNLTVEGNIFLAGLDDVTKIAIAENIYDAVDSIIYRPFTVTSLGRPYIEVGDSVTYYVYDYSSGSPVTAVMSFNILTRSLKGIQWLRDEYTASGEQYQPIIKTDATSKVESEINDIKENVEEISRELLDKQNTIALDILEPTWQAEDADLVFHDNPLTGYRDLFRYDEDHWTKVEFDNRISFVYTEDDDIVPGQTPLASGQIIFVYE